MQERLKDQDLGWHHKPSIRPIGITDQNFEADARARGEYVRQRLDSNGPMPAPPELRLGWFSRIIYRLFK